MNNDKKEIRIQNTKDEIIYSYSVADNTMLITLQKAIDEKVNLSDAKISGDGLYIVNLDGLDFKDSKLNRAVFEFCSMVGVTINKARLYDAKFRYVNLDKANIIPKEQTHWTFATCKLTNIDFGTLDISDWAIDSCDFSNSDLSKAKYDLGQFTTSYLDGTKLKPKE